MNQRLLSNAQDDKHPRFLVLKRSLVVCLILLAVGIGIGCVAVAGNPEVMSINVVDGDFSWKQASCEVLAAGIDYVGSCDSDTRTDVNDGNYNRCGPSFWCANEGPHETCECSGMVRFGRGGSDTLESNSVVQKSSGSIGCNTNENGFNHTDATPFSGRQCWCQPDRLSDVKSETVTPAACEETSSLDGWVPDRNGSACLDAYLSWALVTVIGSGSRGNVTRCAYEYGSPPMSWTHHGERAKSYLTHILNPNVGRTVACSVLSNPPGGEELGSLEDCVVGFSPDAEKSIAWARDWQARVELRYSMCWTALGLGFFLAAPLLAVRFKLFFRK